MQNIKDVNANRVKTMIKIYNTNKVKLLLFHSQMKLAIIMIDIRFKDWILKLGVWKLGTENYGLGIGGFD